MQTRDAQVTTTSKVGVKSSQVQLGKEEKNKGGGDHGAHMGWCGIIFQRGGVHGAPAAATAAQRQTSSFGRGS
jgi:hypothetical protein